MLLKKLTFLIAVTIMLTLSGCQNTEVYNKSEKLLTVPEVTGECKFSLLKVGQADAIIMQTENHNIIIDCGEKDDGDEIVNYLSDNGIEKVEYLFITHFDKDHVGGASEVIENIEMGHIVVPDYKGSNDEYKNYINTIKENRITPISLTKEMTLTIDDVLFEVYPPLRKYYSEGDNDFSLAISVTHGDNSFLFTGDAEEVRLAEILSRTQSEYDFLKVPHHGKFNKFTQKFVESVKPVYSVITCSEKNPAEEQTIKILEAVGSTIYYTKDGDISVISNGTEINITQ